MVDHVENGNSEQSEIKKKFKGFKRKSGQKSRFLKKAKKFGNQGKLGHGFEVDSDTYNYFVRVLELSTKNEFEGEDEKAAFITNSFEQTVGEEVNLSKNQMISRVLEIILASADEEILLRFCNAFTPSLRVICCDQFASHVVEKILEIIVLKWASSQRLTLWFENTCQFVLNNFMDFAFDKFSNAVMRRVFYCLSGTAGHFSKSSIVADRNAKSTKLPSAKVKIEHGELKKEHVQVLTDFTQQFLNWHQFNDLLLEVNTSALVQVLAQTVQVVDESLAYQIAVRSLKAINEDFKLDNNTHLYTVEKFIEISTPTLYEFMFSKYFKHRISEMAIHPKAQHTLRKLVTACPNRDVFESIFDGCEDKFEEILKLDFTNIFVAFAETCKRLASRQSEFAKKIKAILLKDDSEESFVEVLAKFNKKFQPRADGTGSTFLLDLNGCLVVQHLLDFHKPLKIVKSLLDLETKKIVGLMLDPKGSHIMDSFFKSVTVGDKNKEKLLIQLKDDLVDMACSKFGSRVLDSVWNWASVKQKAIIASSLSTKISKLNSDPYGKFLSEKCGLHSYKRDPKQWEEFQKSSGKRKAEMDDFVASVSLPIETKQDEESETPVKKKKKKKRDSELVDTAEEIVVKEEPMDLDEVVQTETPKKKKKKKHREELEETIEVVAEPLEEPETETPKKKKRKHKDRPTSDLDIPEVEDQSTETLAESPKKKKKSKKSKNEDGE